MPTPSDDTPPSLPAPPPRPDGIEPDREPVAFVVPLECAGLRLDRFISTRIRWVSRCRAQRIVAGGAADSEGRRLRRSHRVTPGEVIWVYRRQVLEPPPPVTPIRIVHEDEHLVAIDKPAGIVMHPTARYRIATLTRFLRERYPGRLPRIGHRIDRETSGIVLATHTLQADQALKRLFARREVEKLYLALVHGRPDPPEGEIDAPLGHSDTSRIRIKMIPRPDGHPALTAYRLLVGAGPYSLVAVEPRTGRQHQVRAHMAAIGCHLVGDKVYDPDEDVFFAWLDRAASEDPALREHLVLDRHALHAWTVALPHPATGVRCRFIAPIPADIANLVERHAGPAWRDALPALGRDEPAEW